MEVRVIQYLVLNAFHYYPIWICNAEPLHKLKLIIQTHGGRTNEHINTIFDCMKQKKIYIKIHGRKLWENKWQEKINNWAKSAKKYPPWEIYLSPLMWDCLDVAQLGSISCKIKREILDIDFFFLRTYVSVRIQFNTKMVLK